MLGENWYMIDRSLYGSTLCKVDTWEDRYGNAKVVSYEQATHQSRNQGIKESINQGID